MEKSYKLSDIMISLWYRLNSTETTQVPAGDSSQAAMLCPLVAQDRCQVVPGVALLRAGHKDALGHSCLLCVAGREGENQLGNCRCKI